MNAPATAIETAARTSREEQLATMVREIIKADYRRDGKKLTQADDGTYCCLIPLGMLMQAEDALDGTLEEERI